MHCLVLQKDIHVEILPFSTEVDPIAESGDKNRYFYGYKEERNSDVKEVMKTRMRRGSETRKIVGLFGKLAGRFRRMG